MVRQELTIEEIKNCEYEILKYFSDICHKNNLTYYLFYGTLIGAVRHKDFIPWDDDVDVAMPREDYDRLIDIMKSDTEYRILTSELYDDYYYPFAKIVDPHTRIIEKGIKPCSNLGVWIDVFPMDKISKNMKSQHFQNKIIKKLRGLYSYIFASEETIKTEINTKQKKLKHQFSKLFTRKGVLRMIEKTALLYRNSNEYDIANVVWTIRYVPLKPEWFGKPAQLLFRDTLFDVPADYHSILTAIYGDYMKLPPENMRYSDHYHECWRVE